VPGAAASVVWLTVVLGDGDAAGSGARWHAATAAARRTARGTLERNKAPPKSSGI
jgi:hypothetical protein